MTFSFGRTGHPSTPITVTVAGQTNGVHTVSVPSASTRLLDGQYACDAWFTPAVGAPERATQNSRLEITQSIGSGDTELEGWSTWTETDQSAVSGSYLDLPLPDEVNTYVYEMQLTLRGAVHTGWYTRFRMVAGATVVAEATAPEYVRTGSQYSTATYTIETIGGLKYLRFTLGGVTETLTTKIVRYRTRRI